jgi:hypothetical protein
MSTTKIKTKKKREIKEEVLIKEVEKHSQAAAECRCQSKAFQDFLQEEDGRKRRRKKIPVGFASTASNPPKLASRVVRVDRTKTR